MDTDLILKLAELINKKFEEYKRYLEQASEAQKPVVAKCLDAMLEASSFWEKALKEGSDLARSDLELSKMFINYHLSFEQKLGEAEEHLGTPEEKLASISFRRGQLALSEMAFNLQKLISSTFEGSWNQANALYKDVLSKRYGSVEYELLFVNFASKMTQAICEVPEDFSTKIPFLVMETLKTIADSFPSLSDDFEAGARAEEHTKELAVSLLLLKAMFEKLSKDQQERLATNDQRKALLAKELASLNSEWEALT